MTEEFVFIAGAKELVTELDSGAILIHRPLSTSETINFKNSISFRRKGKSFSTKAGEQQVQLANDILLDTKNIGYPDKNGKHVHLGKETRPEDIAHLEVDGKQPKSWKDLVPAVMKMQLIDLLMSGFEDSEKN